MSRREWRQLWGAVNEEDQRAADLQELTMDGEPAPGALILTAYGEDGDEQWVSLPYEDLQNLRDTLTRWLDAQLDSVTVTKPPDEARRPRRDDDPPHPQD